MKSNQSANSMALPKSAIGEIFTPDVLCEWILEQSGIVPMFLAGKTVIDPTCGDGAFLRALVRLAQKEKKIKDSDLARLTGIEISRKNLGIFRQKFEREFPGLSFHSINSVCADFFDWDPIAQFDIFIGNPPWVNFADLPEGYKPRVKRVFDDLGIISNRRALLLGSSRVDVSAAVISKVVSQHLAPSGLGVFLCPFSLFLNEGAHEGFRAFFGKKARVCSLEDLSDSKMFESISTKYGLCTFVRSGATRFPLPYRARSSLSDPPEEFVAEPFGDAGGSWLVRRRGESKPAIPRFAYDQKPRQGVNTCGANHAYIGKIKKWKVGAQLQSVEFVEAGVIALPSQFLFPLMTNECFDRDFVSPTKFILLPHDRNTGRPLEWSDISMHPSMRSFLLKNESILKERKGLLINGWIQRGYWWALLGVGAYSFSKYKIAWRAYGTKKMEAKIFREFQGQNWQGNQALHGFVPANRRDTAVGIRDFLNSRRVRLHLESYLAQGTKSWAQPGKISRLFSFS